MVICGLLILLVITGNNNSMIRIDRYKNINKTIDQSILTKIFTHVPEPDEKDYKRGYITRYFVQLANDPSSYIYEVDKHQYSKISENVFYINVKLSWKLIGTADEVKESNFKSLKFASKKLKNILLYLPYYLQFHKK